MEGVSKDVRDVLAEHRALRLTDDGKKVKCSLTGHEMPCRADVLKAHIAGKKYARQMKLTEFDYDQYLPHLVPSEKKWFKARKQLFCKLTLRHLNRDPHHVRRHVAGRRYQKALKRWEECERTGEVFKPRGGPRPAKTPSDPEDSHDETTPQRTKSPKNRSSGSGEGGDEGWRDLEGRVGSDDEDEDENESDRDSLTDLYPVNDFVDEDDSDAGGDQEDSDSEFEDDSDIPEQPPPKASGKRKAPVSAGNNKGNKPKKAKQTPEKAKETPEKTKKPQKNKQINKKKKKMTK